MIIIRVNLSVRLVRGIYHADNNVYVVITGGIRQNDRSQGIRPASFGIRFGWRIITSIASRKMYPGLIRQTYAEHVRRGYSPRRYNIIPNVYIANYSRRTPRFVLFNHDIHNNVRDRMNEQCRVR